MSSSSPLSTSSRSCVSSTAWTAIKTNRGVGIYTILRRKTASARRRAPASTKTIKKRLTKCPRQVPTTTTTATARAEFIHAGVRFAPSASRRTMVNCSRGNNPTPMHTVRLPYVTSELMYSRDTDASTRPRPAWTQPHPAPLVRAMHPPSRFPGRAPRAQPAAHPECPRLRSTPLRPPLPQPSDPPLPSWTLRRCWYSHRHPCSNLRKRTRQGQRLPPCYFRKYHTLIPIS